MHLDPGNLFVRLDAADKIDLLTKMGSHLLEQGYVKNSFVTAISEREMRYPTGLSGHGFGIAWPHVDSAHIIRPGIAVASLRQSVPFQMMGSPEETVDVRLVFMLLIKNPDEQVLWLRPLLELVKDQDLMQTLVDCDTPQLLYETLQGSFAGI